MPSEPVSKLKAENLGELRERIGLSAAAAAVAGTGSETEMLERLAVSGFLTEATRLIAYALPRREAVWWACMCARHTAPPGMPELERRAVDAAEHWVRAQTDEARRTAFAKAQEAGFDSPGSWAAVAAFWSGGSMAPPGQPVVPPAAHLTGAAVAGAVALAAVRMHPERQATRLGRFLDSGRDVAGGGTGRLPPEES
ncbi:MAG: hypothetical protein JOZ58_17100 [Acetobacteraceae bacterium]|nr:hypothetical protein [Acetobacteraceae bacterium]